MHAGLERNRIRKHLLVFALAAPAMSMLTYLGLSKVSVSIPYYMVMYLVLFIGVQPVAHVPGAKSYDCDPTQNHKLTET